VVGLLAIGLLEAALANGVEWPWALGLVAAMTLPLAWRRRRPASVALAVTTALAVQGPLQTDPLFEQTFTGFVCLLLATYSLGRQASGRPLILVGAGCALATGLTVGLNDADVASGLLGTAIVLGTLAGGWAVHRRTMARELLELQARELEVSKDAATKAATINARLRIAGEVEDVVSHRVSEMLVQAQAARSLAARDPTRAADALASVEAKGREALGELRRLLGVLRRGDEDIALRPSPGLDRLGALLEERRTCGQELELVVEGERIPLPPAIDLAAYRVIESALGDATDGSRSEALSVRVRFGRRALHLEIAVRRRAGAFTGDSEDGAGTLGARQLVTVFGGDVRLDSRSDGVRVLAARLPLDAGGSKVSQPAERPEAADPRSPPTPTPTPGARLARRARQAEALLAVVLIGAMVAEAATAPAREGPLAANALVAGLVGAPLLLRRRYPLATSVLGWGSALAMTVFLTPATETAAFGAIVLLYSYTAGAHGRPGRAEAGLAVGLIGVVALNFLQPAGPRWGDLMFPALLVGLSWLVGRNVRTQSELAREIAERAQRIERARESEAIVVVAGERQRMARELHDVVAHALSVMVIQGGAARRSLERAPDRALEGIAAVERAGREALKELRCLLTLAFPTAAADRGLAPQPGVGQLGALIEHTRAAGLPVELRIEGRPVSLPGGLDLAAYRVVQEALTNTLRHAGAAQARVTIRYGDQQLSLRIEDDGRATAAGEAPQRGHGIDGMRERVRLYGGELVTGPRRAGGFEVAATLPLSPSSPWSREPRGDIELPSRQLATHGGRL
jgi:signal transduction histidine kinase